jgi:Rrf2 family protein
MFSKACEYAIKASIFVAQNSIQNRKVTPKQISENIASPEAFTAKIMQELVKQGLVNSYRGAYGGFEMDNRKIRSTNLAKIVTAIDGDEVYKGCGLGLTVCDENRPCPVHNEFKTIREELRRLLESTYLEQLALGIEDGMAFLKV